jgi:flagellar motor switch protein FliN/FliY
MSPERDKNSGPENAAVGLESEEVRSTGRDETGDDHTTAHVEVDRSDALQADDRQVPHTEPLPAGARAEEHDGAGATISEDQAGGSVRKAEFQEVSSSKDSERTANLDLLLDVVVPVSVELGRTSLTVKDILSTYQGSVIELDRSTGEPVDIMVGGKPLARGEVVVVKGRFGVRVTELMGSIESVAKA